MRNRDRFEAAMGADKVDSIFVDQGNAIPEQLASGEYQERPLVDGKGRSDLQGI
ncbi:MAG TPA: hypothetical protein VG605_01845 [Puia sp.]|nr:hypothetical protein [Puia sp.]